MGVEYTGVWKLLYDWQTLITGVAALLAAVVAAWPAWGQLKSLRVQSMITSREILISRVAAIEARRAETVPKVRSMISGVWNIVPPEGEDAFPGWTSVDPYSAEGMQRKVEEVIKHLTAEQETSFDGAAVDAARMVLLERGRTVEHCLAYIHQPDTLGLVRGSSEPAGDLSKEQVDWSFEERNRAQERLGRCVAAASKAADNLDAAFGQSLEQLRARIRQIDASVGSWTR